MKTLSDWIINPIRIVNPLTRVIWDEKVKDFIKKSELIILQKTISDEEKVFLIRIEAGKELTE